MDTKDNKDILNNEIIDNDDVSFEIDEEDADVLSADSVRNLREKLKKCVEEKQEYLDGWQRARAELVNARKRDNEERKDFLKFAKEDLINQFLSVLDSFDMAFSNKEAWEKAPKEWRVGVEYIYSQFLSVMTNNGVKQLNPVGERFDPQKHISTESVFIDAQENDGIIISVVQKGYELNGRIIREARVKVGEYKNE